MALLSSGQSFLGIDLGAGAIKLVELRNDQGRPRLVTYGMYEVPLAEVVGNDWSERKPQAIAALKTLIEQSGVTSNLAIAALPTFAVFSSLISVPDVSAKELPDTIRLEAKKVVPRPIEEMVLDWKEVAKTEITGEKKEKESKAVPEQELGTITGSKGREQKKILITAAPQDLVNNYVEIFKEVGLRLASLETEALALSRSLIGRDPSVVMIVDMGAKTTNLSIVEQGIPVVNRGVSFGGITVSKELSQRMGLSLEQAEQWKRDAGLKGAEAQLSPSIKSILDDLLHEVEYLFQLYRRQFSTAPGKSGGIEKIVLAGGSSFVPGLANYLADSLNVPVHLGDPWARIIYPEDLSSLLPELGPSMAVAIGLAMRHIGSK